MKKKSRWTEEEEKAIKDSIKHWEKDIVAPLCEGRKIIEQGYSLVWEDTKKKVHCMDLHCPLCHMVGKNESRCSDGCPYYVHYDFSCDMTGDGHWAKFREKPNLKTAVGMVNALKKLLPTK